MKKLCTFGGCKEIVEHSGDGTSPRCTKHTVPQKKYTPTRYEHHEDSLGRNIYRTKEWRRLRKAKLLFNPLCQRCLTLDRSTMAQMVDHIIEIKDGGAIYDIKNLQSLCNPCHNTKTGLEKRKRNKKDVGLKLSDF